MKRFMKKLWEKKNSKKGFTLVELIVVMVILAVMAAILIPSMVGWINKANDKKYVLQARAIMTSTQVFVTEYYSENNNVAPTVAQINEKASDIEDMSGISDIEIEAITYANGTDVAPTGNATIIGMKVAFTPTTDVADADTVTYELKDGAWSKVANKTTGKTP